MMKNTLLRICLTSGLLIIILFSAVFTIFLLSSRKNTNVAPDVNDLAYSPSISHLNLYSISGKIKNIDNNKILIEALTNDSIIKPLSEKKLENRELEVGSNTKITRLNFVPRKEGVKMPENPTVDSFGSLSSFGAEYKEASMSDLHIGDNISADYSENLVFIKNFIPETITILPYSIF